MFRAVEQLLVYQRRPFSLEVAMDGITLVPSFAKMCHFGRQCHYLLAQNAILILSPALVLILKTSSSCEAILDCMPKMSEDVYCPSNCQMFLESSAFLYVFFPRLQPPPPSRPTASNLKANIPKLFPTHR